MSRQIIVDSENRVELKLTVVERKLVIRNLQPDDSEYQERIQQAPVRKPIPFDIDELRDLHQGLSFALRDTKDAKHEKGLLRVLNRIESLLEPHFEPLDFSSFEIPDPEFAEPLNPLAALFGFGEPTDESIPSPVLAAKVCHIRLTKAQRDLIQSMDTIPADVHRLLEVDSKSEKTFALNSRQSLVLGMAATEAMQEVSPSKQRTLDGILERLGDGMSEAMIDEEEGSDSEFARPKPTSAVYRLKITLENTKPAIWRRIEVADSSLGVLHEIIQDAMGWMNCHMHEFQAGGDRFTMAEMDEFGDEEDAYDEDYVLLSQVIDNGIKKLRYWYDFGDDWWHTIKIEKTLEPESDVIYPRCLGGACACPPEDVGGVWGYYNFLDALNDPQHEQHGFFKEWYERVFDPESFSVDAVNGRLT